MLGRIKEIVRGAVRRRGRKCIVLIGTPLWATYEPSCALAVVATIVREAGIDVKVYDLNIDFYHRCSNDDRKYWNDDWASLWMGDVAVSEELWAKYGPWLKEYLDSILQSHSPILIGFSVGWATLAFATLAARYIQSHQLNIPIMFGGVDCLPGEKNKALLTTGPDRSCDIICQGEAEIAFRQFLEGFKQTGQWKTRVPGFAYYDGEVLVDTGKAALPTLQGPQPVPAFDLFTLSKYSDKGMLPFYLSRGCFYQCTFCGEKADTVKHRSRHPREAFDGLKSILPYAVKFSNRPIIHLCDSNINANMKLLDELADLIIESKIQIRWGGQAHIHPAFTPQFIDKLARAGLDSMNWGIETGSERVARLMNKKYRHSDARCALRSFSQAGIQQLINIIIGFPGELPLDFVDTLQFILEFKQLPHCRIGRPTMLVARPNSPLYKNYASFGMVDNCLNDWALADGTNTLYIRLVRRFVALQAWGNDCLTRGGLLEDTQFRQVNLNDPNIFTDLFQVIHENFRRANAEEQFYSALDALMPNVRRLLLGGANDKSWLALQLGMEFGPWNAEQRNALDELILRSLRVLREAVVQHYPWDQTAPSKKAEYLN